jgi:hypothetical protein
MATAPRVAGAPFFKPLSRATANDDDARLLATVQKRIARAEHDRNRHKGRLDSCYRLALPWRHRIGETQHTDTLDDIYDSTTMTTVEDFAADMLTTFTPMKNAWVAAKPVSTLDTAAKRQIEGPLQEFTATIFDEMRRSNLYQALQECYLDLAPGTMALLVQDRHPSQPIHCEAVPSPDLLIERGVWGGVDGRWRKWRVLAEDIPILWPRARKPHPQAWKPGDMEEIDVIDGLYRDWSDVGTEKWHYCVLVGGNYVALTDTYTGSGSCPMVVARWSRDSTTAWGIGPLYRSIPDVKTLNHVKYLGLKNLDKVVDPPFSYEDDGIINLDHGIEPGTGIPRAQGSDAPEPIESKGRFDVEWAHLEDLRSQIRRAHYQDRPEQTGKTPPTAFQWADEAAERARRMGTPATNLVIEWQYPIFSRFAYLLAKRGALPKVELNGEEIALEPESPLLRAQEQEEVVRADRFVEMLGARFGPEALNMIVKQDEYALWLAGKMGVPLGLVRTREEMIDAIEQMAPLIAGGAGGEAPAGAPA